jgi:hypothetical protein
MNASHLLAAGTLALALLPTSEQSRGPVQLEAAECRQTMMFGDYQTAYAVQHAAVPMSAGVLEIQPGANGGVRVEKGSGSTYSITACIGAGARTREEAQRAVDGVQLLTDGSRIRVANTENIGQWSVQLIVEAPDGAQLNVETRNGPIGIRGVDGKITARAQNGPISVSDASGQITAIAVNGPVSVNGSQGEFDLETQNGPISVDLQGSRWEGKLDARAQNGPLSVRIPDNYTSGVEITSSGRSPWNCRGTVCQGANSANRWDRSDSNREPRTLKIGNDPVVVRISTVNGPVSIDNR